MNRRIFALFLAAAALAGCSAEHYRREADEVASAIIAEKQREALGQAEPFTIEPAAVTLRNRLLAKQLLPTSGPASWGAQKLPPVPHYPREAVADRPDPLLAPTIAEIPDDRPLELSLLEALQIAAANSREYQTRKEAVFRAALDLDLERDRFRFTWSGLMEALFETNLAGGGRPTNNLAGSASAGVTKRLKTGASIASRLIFDVAQLLSDPGGFSKGLAFDGSITIPLLAGAGEYVVAEPLTQAERDVVYELWRLARFRKTFAVDVASSYLGVVQLADEVDNARENYRNLIASAVRARALADAGRLPEIQVDLARQDELRARDRWISAMRQYGQRLDTFKILLGLPTDAKIDLQRQELARLAESAREKLPPPTVREAVPAHPDQPVRPGETPPLPEPVPPTQEGAGPLELPEPLAVDLALKNRLDLRTSIYQVADAQRKIAVAANALQAGLDLVGTANAGGGRGLGSATADDAQLRFEEGRYAAALTLDLPWEKTAERNALRVSIIALQQAVRSVQAQEDDIKLQIRNALRTLAAARESYLIQTVALEVARRRVESTTMFLQAGRAEIRDVLEAQESLVNAQNALTAALVNYRIAELQLQRDMGVLQVNEKGLWNEYRTETPE